MTLSKMPGKQEDNWKARFTVDREKLEAVRNGMKYVRFDI